MVYEGWNEYRVSANSETVAALAKGENTTSDIRNVRISKQELSIPATVCRLVLERKYLVVKYFQKNT